METKKKYTEVRYPHSGSYRQNKAAEIPIQRISSANAIGIENAFSWVLKYGANNFKLLSFLDVRILSIKYYLKIKFESLTVFLHFAEWECQLLDLNQLLS